MAKSKNEPILVPSEQKDRSSASPASPRIPKKMPREWFARLRIREDRLARLWVRDLMGRDVVVWSPKERRWVALLAVPELRTALRAAEIESNGTSRSSSHRPSTIPPARLSRPPAALPPEPPPPLSMPLASSLGELRLESIAQQAMRRSVPPDESPRHRPHSYPPTKTRDAEARARHRSNPSLGGWKKTGWRKRTVERLAWVTVGILLVLALSGVGTTNQHSSYFSAAAVEISADGPSRERSLSDWFQDPLHESQALAESPEPRDCPSPPQTATVPPERQPDLSPNRALRTPAFALARNDTSAALAPEFDLPLARIALINAASAARGCPGIQIAGRVVVTFDPSGIVRAVDIPLLIGDGVDRDCIARTFQSVVVPRFSGGAVAVKKEF